MKPDIFEVLERRRSGNRLEILVERRHAHARMFSQVLGAECTSEISVDELQHSCDSHELIISSSHRAQRSLRDQW